MPRRKPVRRAVGKKRSADLDRRLSAIYGSASKAQDLQKIEREPRHRLRSVIVSLAFVVLAGAGAWFA
ncbi:MAG: hypothetical protein Q7R83_02395, partial [bacterium]|nr:hypothetical protein [bacterium]